MLNQVMRYQAAAYVLSILVVGIGGAAASIVFPDNADVLIVIAQVALAVLTFPLGFVASAAGAYGVVSGTVTVTEALVFATPLHALLGYVQWCRLVPAFYRSEG
jgi:hypothetical protein